VTTIANVIDRTFRTYLEPPDARAAACLLAASIDNSTQSVQLTNWSVPEDEQLIRLGIRIEIGSELMRVTAYDEPTATATVLRGYDETTAAAHAIDDEVKLSPPYPRQSVFEAVADNIIGLSPRLFQVKADQLSSAGANVYPVGDTLALDVVEVWPDEWHMGNGSVEGRIVDYHPDVGGRALITQLWTGSVWLRYRTRMGVATSEADELADLGVEDRWVNIIMAGAAADLLVGRDIGESHVEWVGKVLKAENVRVGTRQSLAIGLAQYREILIGRFETEMKAEYKPRVRMRNAFDVRTRGGFG
jgi:hypothetical protein